MLVRCPKCQTGFNLAVEKVPERGAKLRCSACANGFRVKVGADGGLEIVDRNASPELDGDRTQLGGLLGGHDEATVAVDHDAAGSASSRAGYDPFPHAGIRTKKGNSTQMFGGGSLAEESSDGEVELFDDEPLERNDRTLLGPAGLTPPGQVKRKAPPKNGKSRSRGPVSTERGAAVGSDDIFDIKAPEAEAPVDLSDDFDPFGDAFSDDSNSGGLVLPSSPKFEPAAESSAGLEDSEESEGAVNISGKSAEDFFGGGGAGREMIDYGGMDSQVEDTAAGHGMEAFDPHATEEESAPAAPKAPAARPGLPTPDSEPMLELDLARVEAVDSAAAASKPPRAAPVQPKSNGKRGPQTGPAPAAAQSARQAAPIPVTAPHLIGASSSVRRFFDVAFIVLVVVVAFVSFVAFQAGGFMDFSRFGHMLEVAFEGEAFEPRPEWERVVTAEPVDPPPDEPMRLINVTATELELGKERVMLVSGTLRNHSNRVFSGVEIYGAVVGPDDKVIQEQTVPAGRELDRAKARKAKTPAAVEKLIAEKLPDVGVDGAIPFTLVFSSLPAEEFDAGKLDYRVALAE